MKLSSKAEAAQPFFSIVIASLNNFCALSSCINSINAQSFMSYEVLVSDGGSSDLTQSILNSECIRNLSWSRSSSDLGIYDALNYALSEVRGRWVLVLGSDDRLCDVDSLLRASVAITNYQGVTDLFYSDLQILDSGGSRLKKYPDFDRFINIFSGAPFIHHQTAFVSHRAIRDIGKFDTEYRIHADYDLILHVLNRGRAVKINDAFVEYNSFGFSSRLVNILKSVQEVRNIRRKHGFRGFNLRLGLIYSRMIIRSAFKSLRSNLVFSFIVGSK
jgi:glycosyltransferase involved in cell wall biosynthesis